MNVLLALVAVILLAAIAFLGTGVAQLYVLFGVILPGVALVVFILGLIVRVVNWARTPVPFNITTTCGQQKSLDWAWCWKSYSSARFFATPRPRS
jgi:hypothetical protein